MAGRSKSYRADYFPMSVSNGKRFNILYAMTLDGVELKHKAPLTWFVLLQQLAGTDYHFIDVSDELDLMALANVCKVNDREFVAIVDMMVRIRIVDRDLWEKYKIIWIQELVDSLDIVYRKRDTSLPTIDDVYQVNSLFRSDIDISERELVFSTQKKEQRKEGRKEVSKERKEGVPEGTSPIHPTLEDVQSFFLSYGFTRELADKAYHTYQENGWRDTKGNPIKDWKVKMQKVWMKPDEPKSHTTNGTEQTQIRAKLPNH